jgi:hypothetical protein
MTNDAAVAAPEPVIPAADVPVAADLSSWEKIQRWILTGLFVFGLLLPFAGAVLAAILL